MKLTCPKSFQSCQTGDYQIKIIDNRPKPEPINLDWLDHPKMDAMSKVMTWFCCGAWLLILLAIFFS